MKQQLARRDLIKGGFGLGTALLLEGCFRTIKAEKNEIEIDGITIRISPMKVLEPYQKDRPIIKRVQYKRDTLETIKVPDMYSRIDGISSVSFCFGNILARACITEYADAHIMSLIGMWPTATDRFVPDFTTLKTRYLNDYSEFCVFRSWRPPIYNGIAIPSRSRFEIIQSGMPRILDYKDAPILGAYIGLNAQENEVISGAVCFVGD